MTPATLAPRAPLGEATAIRDRVEEAFANGDCWALALALADVYQDLTVCILTSEDPDALDWIHMLVRDDRDPTGDTYVDVFGVQTASEVVDRWDHILEWEEIAPIEGPALDEAVRGTSRYWPEVHLREGIARILTTGWQPPPYR